MWGVAYCRFASDEGLAVNEVDDVCVSQPPFAFVWVQAVQGKACGITPSPSIYLSSDSHLNLEATSSRPPLFQHPTSYITNPGATFVSQTLIKPTHITHLTKHPDSSPPQCSPNSVPPPSLFSRPLPPLPRLNSHPLSLSLHPRVRSSGSLNRTTSSVGSGRRLVRNSAFCEFALLLVCLTSSSS